MGTIREQMKELLGETVDQADQIESEEMEAEVEVDMKALAPQLLLAMQAMGLDVGNDEHLDAFMKTLKVMATSKANIMKTALRRWSGARAARAVKVAKATL